MKLQFSYLFLSWLAFFAPLHIEQGVPSLWQPLAPGISFREFYLPGPNHVYVARMERLNPQVTLETSIAQGRLSGGLETVREMAARYDQAINYWGEEWGGRNQVVVAINGSFFDPDTGVPTSGQAHSGWYVKRFNERQSGSGFAWTMQRQPFIGGCVVHPPAKQVITRLASGKTFPFDAFNIPREDEGLVIYTPQYDSATLTGDDGLEVQVQLSRPMLIIPLPDMITGTVRLVRDGQGSTPIPFDHIVLSAAGKARDELRGQISVGDVIGISQEIRHLDPGCKSPSPLSWTKTYASLAGGYVFLKDGVIQSIDELGSVLRNPRTALVYNDSYIFFLVVDGRQQLRSTGMSMAELAVFARTYLGAAQGIALDGGGSTTMVVDGEVKNHPNANLSDRPADLAPSVSPVPAPVTSVSPSTNISLVERAVANGMMMVVVQPKEVSVRYIVGQPISTIPDGEVLLRLGPGTNYAALASLPAGSPGVILDHPLNGVLAKGHYWWNGSFGDMVGWVSESLIMSR